MAFTNSTRFVLRFDATPLVEAVTSNPISVAGNDAEVVLEDEGYRMQSDQYLYMTNFVIGITTAATVGFRFVPRNLGQALGDDGGLDPMRMPLIDVGPGFVSGEDYISTAGPAFRIYEEAMEDSQNRLIVQISPQSGFFAITQTFFTDRYDADIEHHVMVVYDGTGSVKVYIDGRDQVVAGGSVPADLSFPVGSVWVNNQMFPSAYDVLRNTGSIKEIFVLNRAATPQEAQLYVNSGLDFLVDSNGENQDELDYGLLFNDPNAVKVTDLYEDGTYLYATRTDGRLLQGSPLLWQSRKEYSDSRESSVLKKFGTGVQVADGFLKITDGTVKL